ncbi:DNA primase [Candidatus Bathyarchaeota archaeon]|nr:DNA primase [Candidatus Bathyarchaeota archaeon]
MKYEIRAKFTIQGVVEKSDVVGAIFGQTEGLIGEELDIRELQKSGRIGRINVEMESKDGLTTGYIIIPSSLDRVETAIMAATIETVDRVGPCIAEFELESLEDVRKKKRDKIIGRATELLQKWDLEVAPETQEITDKVSEARLSDDIVTYGEENLPAGPEVEMDATIIICEGRADVLNLLSIGVKNAIATNGTKVPKTIAQLSKKKTTIAFLDGDRGGDMILNELLQVGKIDFVARAPQGKEVEDLTKKDLLKALQGKVAYVNNKPVTRMTFTSQEHQKHQERKQDTRQLKSRAQDTSQKSRNKKKYSKKPSRTIPAKRSRTKVTSDAAGDIPDELRKVAKDVLGTTKARFLDENLKLVKEVPTSLIVDELQKEDGNIKNILFDGIISQRLLDISTKEGVKIIIGTRIGNVKKPRGIKVYSISDIAA